MSKLLCDGVNDGDGCCLIITEAALPGMTGEAAFFLRLQGEHDEVTLES